MDNVKGIIYEPFSPKIGKFKLPDSVINEINTFVENLDKENLKKELDHGPNLAGQVTQEIKLTKEILSKGLLNVLAKATQAYISNGIKKEITKFNLLESWIVRQFENEYNPVHLHGGHISGAGFLKLPKSFGNFTQKNEKKEKLYQGGTLNLVHGQRSFLSESIFTIIPEVGNFYLFPHYLMHTVYPFKGTSEERRSISFNAMVDERLFNNL